MLAGSNLIYFFASLRKAVKKAIREGQRSELYKPELILGSTKSVDPLKTDEFITQMKKKLDSSIASRRNFKKAVAKALESTITCPVNRALNRYLEREIPLVDIYEFVIHNGEFCGRTLEKDFDVKQVKQNLEEFRELGIGIFEFDDEFQDSELVFGISINRKRKRLTVCFRGSVLDSKDWSTNLKFLQTPLAMKADNLSLIKSSVKVHSGYNGYMNDALDDNKKKYNPAQEFILAAAREYGVLQDQDFFKDSGRSTKFDQIIGNLEVLYERFNDYELYVCGHSLGGALSQLLSFQLACDGRLAKHARAVYPITAITFASPCVGNDGFRKAYQELEAKNCLRHLRISNEGDVIPVLPAGGYTQTGVHLHALKDHEKPAEVGYRLVKPFLSQVTAGFTFNLPKLPDSFLTNHGCEEYHNRLFGSVSETKKILLEMTIEKLYEQHAVPRNYTT
jgi:hypothetical protein